MELYKRHRLAIRVMHWINVIAATILLMSGLNIFNAHPALYWWGKSSYTGAPPVLEMGALNNPQGGLTGVTTILGHAFETTGVLGASRDSAGNMVARGFPSWATIPDTQWLSMARRWHLFFAWVFAINGIAYVLYSAATRHLSRDLAPKRREWRTVGREIIDHALLRHPTGEAAKHYNLLQKLAYLGMIFGVLPLLILMGLGLSPWMNSVIPGWVDFFGGRQAARTLHFAAACMLLAFVLVHVFEVIVTGFFNNVRSMVTGWYRVPQDKPVEPTPPPQGDTP